jgi:hypothetical protein
MASHNKNIILINGVRITILWSDSEILYSYIKDTSWPNNLSKNVGEGIIVEIHNKIKVHMLVVNTFIHLIKAWSMEQIKIRIIV